MADTDISPADSLAQAQDWLRRIQSGSLVLADDDTVVLQAIVSEIRSAREAAANTAEWLRARAELALAKEDDPEQPGHEEFSKGWRSGAYNSLYLAANAVERGETALPRERWPAYMRGESLRPASSEQILET